MNKIIFPLLAIILSTGVCSAQNKHADTKKIKLGSHPIEYSVPVHSLGFAWHSSLAFAPRLCEASGDIAPDLKSAHQPEFLFHYTCIFPNHFGFTLEVPFGVFQRHAVFDLDRYGAENLYFEAGSFYVGFAPKLAYAHVLDAKCILQAEFGLKFMPFIHPSTYWDERAYYNPNSDIIALTIHERAYLIPDATASIQFLIHGKKRPQNNFVAGLTANLSFVRRMSMSYDSRRYGSLPNEAISFGSCSWNTSSIGIMIGYRFLGLRP